MLFSAMVADIFELFVLDLRQEFSSIHTIAWISVRVVHADAPIDLQQSRCAGSLIGG